MDFYICGEIKTFAGTKVPAGWLLCDGATLSTDKNEVLFALLGTKYGGNGISTFCLPDLRGRVPLGHSRDYPIGSKGGQESVQLTAAQLPSHGHVPSCSGSSTSDSNDGTGAVWASASTLGLGYGLPPGSLYLNDASIGAEGGGQSHENRMPFQAINYIICEVGIFPPRA